MSGVTLRIAQIYHADENFGKYMETKYSYLIYIFENISSPFKKNIEHIYYALV